MKFAFGGYQILLDVTIIQALGGHLKQSTYLFHLFGLDVCFRSDRYVSNGSNPRHVMAARKLLKIMAEVDAEKEPKKEQEPVYKREFCQVF